MLIFQLSSTSSIPMAEASPEPNPASSQHPTDARKSDVKAYHKTQTLKLDQSVSSMTEKRTIRATFHLPQEINVSDLEWTFGDKPLPEWKKYTNGDYKGSPFISVEHIDLKNGEVTASIIFDLPYDTVNLSEPRL